MTWKEYRDRARHVRAMADRTAELLRVRAVRETRQAGLDPSVMGIHLHNAWIADQAGRPWAGVDHAKLRRARRTFDRLCEPYALAASIERRLFARARAMEPAPADPRYCDVGCGS